MSSEEKIMNTVLDQTIEAFDRVLEREKKEPDVQVTGTVKFVGQGIANVTGLPGLQSEELVRFPGNLMGMAFNLDPDEVGVILLDESRHIEAGDEVRRTGRVLDVPVGENLLGRVVDSLGRPMDDKGPIRAASRMPVEREASGILDRAPVNVPLQTGIKVIDALIPIGRGQRELILGDRQTGKTAIAVDTILNQKGKDVICIYCAIGKQSSDVATVIEDFRQRKAMDYIVVVVTSEDNPPGLRYVAPYAAATIGEYFRDNGMDALVVFDDLTRHARAYREISLLLRRPPGREAYPGDIFYIHSRLLERSTHLNKELGGGSLTALPIIETEAQNLSAYIPTNLISITDGQIYLSPTMFQKGTMPAVDAGKSVSRVGGKTQLPAYRAVAGDLRLSYSQFRELESFARFGTRLDDQTRETLERGYRVREVLKQDQYQTMPAPEQIAVLFAMTEGILDGVPVEKISEVEDDIRKSMKEDLPELCHDILEGKKLDEESRQKLEKICREVVEGFGSDRSD